jgi:hypothetical protein
MSFRIVLPTGLSLKDWADQIVYDLDPYGSFEKLENEAFWQDWAARLLTNADLTENLPSPYDWRDWAERFCQAI